MSRENKFLIIYFVIFIFFFISVYLTITFDFHSITLFEQHTIIDDTQETIINPYEIQCRPPEVYKAGIIENQEICKVVCVKEEYC